MKDEREIVFVRYEDLCENQAKEIIRLVDFFAKSIPAERVIAICQKKSRATMLKVREARPVVGKGYDVVRKPGNTRLAENELTQEMKNLIWQRCKIAMEVFGYSSKISANSKGRQQL